MVLVGGGVAVVVIVVILIVVLTKGGGNGVPSGVPVANTITQTVQTESTFTESSATETNATTPAIESSQVEQVLSEYEQDYSNEDIEGLEGLFATDLERTDGSRPTEDLTAALATYREQFGKLQKPVYVFSEVNVKPASEEANATAQYSITSQNGTVTGSIQINLIDQEGKLLIDKLTIEPSTK